MAKFRKKPVVIEAVQFWPDRKPWPDGVVIGQVHGAGVAVHHIMTLEGAHVCSPGDWIITGVAGERYPCKPDIFEKTYEAAGPRHQEPVPIHGIWLRALGTGDKPGDPVDVDVLIEREPGTWCLAIREHGHGMAGMISHIVEPAGMLNAPKDPP